MRVTVGGDDGRRRRWGVLAAVAAVLGLIGAGVALGGDDDGTAARESTTSTTRRRVTTTSTTPPITAPHGPVLPVRTGGALLLATFGGPNAAWVHLDLDTGTRTELRGAVSPDFGPIGVRGGIVTLRGPSARFVALPSGEPVELGEADQLLAAHEPDAVWLVRGNRFDGGPEDDEITARLVGVPDGEPRSREVRVPDGSYVSGTTTRGLVVVAGGRSYLASPDGDIAPLAGGEVHFADGRYVAATTCDDRARCRAELIDVETGAHRPLGVEPGDLRQGIGVAVSSAGEIAISVYGPRDTFTLRVGTVTVGLVGEIEVPAGGGLPAWLPGGQGLVFAHGPGGVTRYVIEGDEVREETIPALQGDYGDQVVVIPP